jgi:outer membrane protein assembly factor BamA
VKSKKAQLLIPVISVILLFFPLRPAFSGEDIIGKRARSITFAVDSPFEVSFLELANLLSITRGEIITRENIRKSVSGLNSKGIFKEISVYGEVFGNEVDLVFHVEPSVSIASIKVKGAKYFSGKEVIAKLRLREGKRLTSIDASQLKRRLADLYRENGYFKTKVEVKVACAISDGTSEVLIHIDESERPIIGAAEIRGNENISDDVIMEKLNIIPGQSVSLKRIKRKIGRLMKMYKNRGFLLVNVGEPELIKVKDEVRLVVTVEEGKRYLIEFTGNERYSTARLKRVSGIFSDT